MCGCRGGAVATKLKGGTGYTGGGFAAGQLSGTKVQVRSGPAVVSTVVMHTKDRQRLVMAPNDGKLWCIPIEDANQYPNIYEQTELGTCS